MTDAMGSRGAPADGPRDPVAPTVVMVHGAWLDATGWREVIALLHLKGLSVVAVQCPLNSLADDADAVTRVIHHQSAPVVLVGQGYGGTIITQAGDHSKVAALIYVAAFAPDVGESTTDLQKSYPPSPCVARFEVDAGGFLYLAHDAVSEFLAHDLPAVDNRILAAAQKPVHASVFLDRVAVAAWRTKPCWYAVTDEDRMISPALQRQIALTISAKIVVLHAGHVPFLSKPKETANVILDVMDLVRAGTVQAI